MPFSFAPNKSTAHRLACLSLYKSLLRRCSNVIPTATFNSCTTDQSPSSTLQNLVRYRFQRDKKFKNWPQIRNALQFGRGALELLDQAATGSAPALEEIARQLSASADLAIRRKEALKQVQNERAQRQTFKKVVKLKERESRKLDKTRYLPNPDNVPVLQRPVPYEQANKDEDGNRRVPDYFVVSAIPFLRYNRRQSAAFSQHMTQQIKEYEDLWIKLKEYRAMTQMAELEDEWDRILWQEQKLKQPDLAIGEGEWGAVPRAILADSWAKVKDVDSRRLEHGKQLWNVYLKEKTLAEAETAQRKGKTEVQQDTSSTDVSMGALESKEHNNTLQNFRPFLLDG